MLGEQGGDITELQAALEEANKKVEELTATLAACKSQLDEVWRANCIQLREFKDILSAKEEVERLKTQLSSRTETLVVLDSIQEQIPAISSSCSSSGFSVGKRTGKAPPVDPFNLMSYNLMTGYPHCSGHLIGMVGGMRKSCYSWLVISGVEHFKSGHC